MNMMDDFLHHYNNKKIVKYGFGSFFYCWMGSSHESV